MNLRRIKLLALLLSVGQSVLGLVSVLLLARLEGASTGYALFAQTSALLSVLNGFLGVEFARHHMVHVKLSVADSHDHARQLFSALVLARLVTATALLALPVDWIEVATGLPGIGEASLVTRLIGLQCLSSIAFDAAYFVGVTRGKLLSAPAAGLAIQVVRLGGILVAWNALEGALIGMIVGELLVSLVMLLRWGDRETLSHLKPTRFVRTGFQSAIPTSVLGMMPMAVIWIRNHFLDVREVALFAYINPLLIAGGTVFAMSLLTTEAVFVSDRKRSGNERASLALAGFGQGLAWALGMMAFTIPFALWIAEAAFAAGGGKLSARDTEALAEILRGLAVLAVSATLYQYSLRVALALGLRRQFLAFAGISLGLMVAGLVAADGASLLVVGLLSGLASGVVCIGTFASLARREKQAFLTPRMVRGLVIAPVMAGAGLAVVAVLDGWYADQGMVAQVAVLGLLGLLLMSVYLMLVLRPSLGQLIGLRKSS